MMKIYSAVTMTPILIAAVFVGAVILSQSVPQDSDQDPALIEDERLEASLQEARFRTELKATILHELIERRISLSSAAREIHDSLDPISKAKIRKLYPAKSAEESVALQTISALKSMNLDPRRLEEIVNRLELELAEMRAEIPDNKNHHIASPE